MINDHHQPTKRALATWPASVRLRDADHAALSATEHEDVDAVLRGDLPLECVEQRVWVFLWRHHAKELES